MTRVYRTVTPRRWNGRIMGSMTRVLFEQRSFDENRMTQVAAHFLTQDLVDLEA